MLEGPLAPLRVVLQRSLADWLIVARHLARDRVRHDAAGDRRPVRRCGGAERPSTDAGRRAGRRHQHRRPDARRAGRAGGRRRGGRVRQSRRILGWTDGELARDDPIRARTTSAAPSPMRPRPMWRSSRPPIAWWSTRPSWRARGRLRVPSRSRQPCRPARPRSSASASATSCHCRAAPARTASSRSRSSASGSRTTRPSAYWLGDALELTGVERGDVVHRPRPPGRHRRGPRRSRRRPASST